MSNGELAFRIVTSVIFVAVALGGIYFAVIWVLKLTLRYFQTLEHTAKQTGQEPAKIITLFIWGVVIVSVAFNILVTWLL
jgi:hypothetical protein